MRGAARERAFRRGRVVALPSPTGAPRGFRTREGGGKVLPPETPPPWPAAAPWGKRGRGPSPYSSTGRPPHASKVDTATPKSGSPRRDGADAGADPPEGAGAGTNPPEGADGATPPHAARLRNSKTCPCVGSRITSCMLASFSPWEHYRPPRCGPRGARRNAAEAPRPAPSAGMPQDAGPLVAWGAPRPPLPTPPRRASPVPYRLRRRLASAARCARPGRTSAPGCAGAPCAREAPLRAAFAPRVPPAREPPFPRPACGAPAREDAFPRCGAPADAAPARPLSCAACAPPRRGASRFPPPAEPDVPCTRGRLGIRGGRRAPRAPRRLRLCRLCPARPRGLCPARLPGRPSRLRRPPVRLPVPPPALSHARRSCAPARARPAPARGPCARSSAWRARRRPQRPSSTSKPGHFHLGVCSA